MPALGRILTGRGPSYHETGGVHGFSIKGRLHPRLEISIDTRSKESIPFKPGAQTIWYVGGMTDSRDKFKVTAAKTPGLQDANIVTSDWQEGLALGDSKLMGEVVGKKSGSGHLVLIMNDRQTYGPKWGRHYTGEEAKSEILTRLEASGVSRDRVTVIGITSWAATRSFADKPELFFEEGADFLGEQSTVAAANILREHQPVRRRRSPAAAVSQ